MSDAGKTEADKLAALREETAEKTSIESGVAHYLRGAMTHMLDLFNNNDWMGARRAAEQIHSDAQRIGTAVAVNTSEPKPAEQ